MNNSSRIILLLLTIMVQSKMVYAYQKTLEYADRTYESTIQTVSIHPLGQSVQSIIAPAVKKIDDSNNLILEFDDIKEDADYFYVRFIHCNSDWTPSDFRSNMVIEGYNEFEIEDFAFSTESKTRYVHYKFTFPQFKKAGNYLAVVYRNQNKNDIILSRRFMIHNDLAKVGARIARSTKVSNRLTHQRIEVTLNYSALNSMDPKTDFKVVVRQNQRWDNAKFSLPITFVNENAKVISFRNLGEANDFKGGNEFRFFDLSTVNFTGRNVKKIEYVNNYPEADIMLNKPLSDSYLQNLDVNGKFFIRDREALSAGITAEYIKTTILLDTPEQRAGIYMIGHFNDWKKEKGNRLIFDPVLEKYKVTLLLKQGWYDYTFWVDDPVIPYQLDKSFFDTENQYEVFVYFRGIGSRGDELVGYTRLDYNVRR